MAGAHPAKAVALAGPDWTMGRTYAQAPPFGGGQGFVEAVTKGPLTQNPVTSLRMALTDGLAHSVDSNELSFRQATKSAFRQGAQPISPDVRDEWEARVGLIRA